MPTALISHLSIEDPLLPKYTTRYISKDLEQVSILPSFYLGADYMKVSCSLSNLQHHCIYAPVILLPT